LRRHAKPDDQRRKLPEDPEQPNRTHGQAGRVKRGVLFTHSHLASTQVRFLWIAESLFGLLS
jgi:hypothetical protein